MRLLIISSEPLNPDSIQSSCFELNQAKALKISGIDTSILAVQYTYSLTRVLRSLSKRFLRRKDKDLFLSACSIPRLISCLFAAVGRIYLGRSFPVKKYNIEGVAVYEAEVQYAKFTTIYASLRLWKMAAFQAFEQYVADEGTPDIVHAHNRYMYAGSFAQDVLDKKAIPYVLTEHSSFYKRNLVTSQDVPVLRKSIERSSFFIIVSPLFINDIEDKIGPLEKTPIFVPNFLGQIFVEQTLGDRIKENQGFSFVNVANLTEVKGHEVLIRAFSQVLKACPGVKLYIAGNGKLWSELNNLTEALNITTSVIFCGQLGQLEVLSLLDRSNVFVLSSHYETFGVVVLEALSRGKPTIVTKCMGPEDLITTSNGLIVPTKDVTALRDAMIAIMNNFSNYDSAGIRMNTLERYHPSVVAEKLKKIYMEVSG